nr:hypothetical protein [Tanacetum cinerariifolium]
MMSFDYRLNLLYTIKECSCCGALYTTHYSCSNRSLVDKITCDLNKAPDSPHLHTFSSNQHHCFQCKDVLGDAKARYWKIPICYDDDKDYTIAITPKEPDNSLSMGDEHLDTISATESDKFIKSSVENLVPNPTDCDLEEEIRLIKKLLYDNSSPRPPEEFNSENYDAIIESFSPSPIPAEDSNPFIEEIDLFLASDGSIPLGIDNDYSDFEGDNLFLERLLHDDHI